MGKRLKFEEKLEEFQNSVFETQIICDNKVSLFHMNKVKHIVYLIAL